MSGVAEFVAAPEVGRDPADTMLQLRRQPLPATGPEPCIGCEDEDENDNPGDAYANQEEDEGAASETELDAKPRTPGSLATGYAPPSVSKVLASPGEPLDESLRGPFGAHFGHDFSRVRVHRNTEAAASAAEVGAAAYTVGHHIVFGAGRFEPGSVTGSSLLAHELTHVVQQRHVRPGGRIRLGAEHSPAEHSAEAHAAGMAALPSTIPGALLQRQPGPACVRLFSRRSLSDSLTGITVHKRIAEDFTRRVGPIDRFQFPDASFAPWRTEGRSGNIPPQTGGGPREGVGNPDLAYRSRTGAAMLIAEIKPANWAKFAEGELQLLNYIDKGNSNDNAELRQRLGVRIFAPMLSTVYRPPARLPVGTKTFRVMWCGPGIIVYQDAAAKKDDKKKKRKKKKDPRNKTNKPKQKPQSKKKPAAKPKPKAKPAAKPKVKTQGKGGAYNFGIGLSINSSSFAAGNIGVGVAINSNGVAVGTVSAGIAYDSDGAAIASVGAGTTSGSQTAGAGTIAAGDAKDVTSAGAGTIGAGSGNSGAAAGRAGTESSEAAGGTAREGGTAGKPGTAAEAGKAGTGTSLEPGAVDKPGGPGHPGTVTGDKPVADGTGAVTADKPVADGTGTGTGTVPADPRLAAIVARLGLDLPKARPSEIEAIVADAVRLDLLVRRASPAQHRLLRMLAAAQADGVYAVPAAAWIETILGATAGLSEEELAALLKVQWQPDRTTQAKLREEIRRALDQLRNPLAAQRPTAKEAGPKTQPATPPARKPAAKPARTKGQKPGMPETGPDPATDRATDTGEAGPGTESGKKRPLPLASTPAARVVTALGSVDWSGIPQGGGLVLLPDRSPALLVEVTPRGTRIGLAVTLETATVAGQQQTQVADATPMVTLDRGKPGDAFTLRNVAGETTHFFFEGSDPGSVIVEPSHLRGLIIGRGPAR
jgi:outer membrane biosynthesis protein TonB